MPLDAAPIIEIETGFERQLLPAGQPLAARIREAAMRLPEGLWSAAGKVGDIKRGLYKPDVAIPDDVVPFLIYELGLEPVAAWVPDLRRVLADGRAWQKIRGTPRSIEMALGWVDFAPAVEELDDDWWDMFSLAFPAAVTDRARLASIIALTRLSKPAHTDLIRVFTPDVDERAHQVNGYGMINGEGLINDWSGVWLRSDWPKVAFGRTDIGRTDRSGITSVTSTVATRRSITSVNPTFGFRVNLDTINGAATLETQFALGTVNARRTLDSSNLGERGGWTDEAWSDVPYGRGGIKSSPVMRSASLDSRTNEPVTMFNSAGLWSSRQQIGNTPRNSSGTDTLYDVTGRVTQFTAPMTATGSVSPRVTSALNVRSPASAAVSTAAWVRQVQRSASAMAGHGDLTAAVQQTVRVAVPMALTGSVTLTDRRIPVAAGLMASVSLAAVAAATNTQGPWLDSAYTDTAWGTQPAL